MNLCQLLVKGWKGKVEDYMVISIQLDGLKPLEEHTHPVEIAKNAFNKRIS